QIVRRGVIHVPQGRSLLSDLSVYENLLLGAHARPRSQRQQELASVYDLFPVLFDMRSQLARMLYRRQQHMVAVGLALMGKPSILMLDEPSLGLAPNLVTDMFRAFSQIRDLGIALFIVEQNALATLELSDRGYVIESGKLVLE